MSILGFTAQLAQTPIGTDSRGQPVYLSPAWINFIRDLFLRVGGASAPTLTEVQGQMGSDVEAVLLATIAELTREIDNLKAQGVFT
jgi:hypothetical protein